MCVKMNLMRGAVLALMALLVVSCPGESDEPVAQYAREFWGERIDVKTGYSWYIASDYLDITDPANIECAYGA